ncbi:MAG: glycosyltransferase family 2 protein [Candidatus Sulfotelmatobacter sp.]
MLVLLKSNANHELPAAIGRSPTPMSAPPSISVVIPVYRAERIVPVLCQRLTASLASLNRPYEVVLIDDRSPDRTWEVMRQMVQMYPGMVAVRLSRNFGQHYAITAGLDLVQGEWTVVMDCDLQDRPEEISRLLETAERGYDIVLARRRQRLDNPGKRLFSRIFYASFNFLSGYRLDPSVGSFRIMKRNVVEAYRSMRESSRLFGGMIEWLGFNATYLDVEHAPRYEGKSSYNLRSMMRLALDGMISFSNRPLYLSIGAGILMSSFSAGFGFFVIIRFLLHPRIAVPGWLSMVTLTTFIGGLILLNLGILGIYIGRIYDQTKGRPHYVVDQIVAVSRSAETGEKEMHVFTEGNS